MLLDVVAQSLKPVKLFSQQLPTLLAQQCWKLLRPFARGLTAQLKEVVFSHLRYGKKGNKKLATCLATLLQNELNSDVARFTTDVQTC